MKKVIIFSMIFLIFIFSGILYSKYHLVDVVICEKSLVMAEVGAMARVSRKELYTVGYCECEGVDPSMKAEVQGMDCSSPNMEAYACVCVGKAHY